VERAEFDKFADEYHAIHAENIKASGEAPEFFAAYKVQDVAARCAALGLAPRRILDFGGGTGSSAPFFAAAFPDAEIVIADVSRRSLDIARERGVAGLDTLLFDGERLPLADASVDIAFAACVFHHIPTDRQTWLLAEIRRVLRPDGRLWVFEHNPWNPLTVQAVNTCPFDENAVLIPARRLRYRLEDAGFRAPRIAYRIFFPGGLRVLRVLEPAMTWLPFGAQYYAEAAP